MWADSAVRRTLAAMRLGDGTVFAGRYRIVTELARGGMGVVYRAEHIETEQIVALKILQPHVLSGVRAYERFRLEARVAAKLESEHIVRVLDAGIDSTTDSAFLAMELLQGHTLQRRIDAGLVDAKQLAGWLLQLGGALDRAHGYVDRDGVGKPIVHRDLKPDNLFIAKRSDGTDLLKILDFGIAKLVHEDASVSRETRGTPLYMAYEQVSGDRVGPWTDVWAIGLIAFFALARRPYWKNARADTATALYGEILHGPIVPASTRIRELALSVDLPQGFDAWFSRCVVREPRGRFSSAGEACEALARMLDPGISLLARPPVIVAYDATTPEAAVATTVGDSLEAVRKTSQPRIRSAALLVVVLLVGAAGSVALAHRRSTPSVEPSSAAPGPISVPAPASSVTTFPVAITTASASAATASPRMTSSAVPAVSTTASKGPPPKSKPSANPNAVWEER